MKEAEKEDSERHGGEFGSTEAQEEEHSRRQKVTSSVKSFCKVNGGMGEEVALMGEWRQFSQEE